MKPGNLPSCELARAALLSMAVAVMPGQSAVTVTPVPSHSYAIDSVSDST